MSLIAFVIYLVIGFVFSCLIIKFEIIKHQDRFVCIGSFAAWPLFLFTIIAVMVMCYLTDETLPWKKWKPSRKKIKIAVSEKDEPDDSFLTRCKRL